MISVNKESWNSGLCSTCIHLRVFSTIPYCDVKKQCGQINACRCQCRVIANGRTAGGRMRSKPLKNSVKTNIKKLDAVKTRKKRLLNIGNNYGLIWMGFLNKSQQAVLRKLIKRGVIPVYHIADVILLGRPANFIKKEDLKKHYRTWDEYVGRKKNG